MATIGGVLLTGGKSRRMGTPKAALELPGGVSVARYLGGVLGTVASWCVEIGPGFTSLETLHDEQPEGGPAVAVATGVKALRARKCTTGLVISCDLPCLSSETLIELLILAQGKSLVAQINGVTQWSVVVLSLSAMEKISTTSVAPGTSLGSLYSSLSDLQISDAQSHARELTDCDTPEEWRRATDPNANAVSLLETKQRG